MVSLSERDVSQVGMDVLSLCSQLCDLVAIRSASVRIDIDKGAQNIETSEIEAKTECD